jgi:hypothetical protein
MNLLLRTDFQKIRQAFYNYAVIELVPKISLTSILNNFQYRV